MDYERRTDFNKKVRRNLAHNIYNKHKQFWRGKEKEPFKNKTNAYCFYKKGNNKRMRFLI